MPIYAYRCETCGHAKDVLQKMSDPVLSTCPACGAETFRKQVTAAGFQLKGSGWYVTDFRGGDTATGKPAVDTTSAPAGEGKDGKPASPATATPAATPAASTSDSKPAAAPAPSPSGPPPASSS